MSSTSRYYHEHLVNAIKRYANMNQQVTVQVGSMYFKINSPEELELAAKLVASYHNQYVSTVPCESEFYREIEDPPPDP